MKKITFLTDAQITKLREYLITNKMYRECAYLDVSYDSAARINEVMQMKKQDLLDNRYSNTVIGKRGKQFNIIIHDRSIESLRLYLDQRSEDDREELWVSVKRKDHNTVIGKRGKQFNIIIHDRSIESLRLYLDQRSEDDREELWVSVKRKDHKPVGREAAYGWTKKMCKILSELEEKPINFSPHCFRHSALENYENGTHYMCRVLAEPKKFSLEELRVLAHHESMDTTKGYLKPKENNVIEGMFGVKIS